MNYVEQQQLAANYVARGQYSLSIELYEQCIEIQPEEVTNYLYLGLAHFLQGNELEAKGIWMSVILQEELEQSEYLMSELGQILAQEAKRQINLKNWQNVQLIYEQIQELDLNQDLSNIVTMLVYELSKEAKELVHQRNYERAESIYHQLLMWEDRKAEFWDELGMVYYHLSQYQKALASLNKALKIDFFRSLYHYHCGLILEKLKNSSQAIQAYQEAIKLEPSNNQAYNNLGNIYYNIGQIEEAEQAYLQAIHYNSTNFLTWINLANVYLVKQQLNLAKQNYETANQLHPNHPEVLKGLKLLERLQSQYEDSFIYSGDYYYQVEKNEEAIREYEKVDFENNLQKVKFYLILANCYKLINQEKQAIKSYQSAIKKYPQETLLYLSLIREYQTISNIEEAILIAHQGLEQTKNHIVLQLGLLHSLPILYKNTQEIESYRKKFQQHLNFILNENSLKLAETKKQALWAIGLNTNFYLQYQGKNDINFQKAYGEFVHKIMAANYPQWVKPIAMPPLTKDKKIRIGYISAHLRHHTIAKLFLGWLRHCDRQQFQIYCYYTEIEKKVDSFTQQFKENSDVFYHIPQPSEAFFGTTQNLEALCQQIRENQLHILVFLDIGMDPRTFQIAALRLAPIQCVTWGHPITTGLPTIDYFLSSDLMEPDDAQNHYTEQLIRLPNLSISYPKPLLPKNLQHRQYFQLREDEVVYLSCQSLYKYLPQYDYIFTEISLRINQAKFVFLAHRSIYITQVFEERLKLVFEKVNLNWQDYCLILPQQSQSDYFCLNLVSDIYLDTFSWSGGNTTLEAIACNLPVVTCPGEFMRGRHSYAMLKMLGITETIANNEAEYIEIAVRLGLDRQWRQTIKEKIQANHTHFYDDQECTKALEKFYQRIII